MDNTETDNKTNTNKNQNQKPGVNTGSREEKAVTASYNRVNLQSGSTCDYCCIILQFKQVIDFYLTPSDKFFSYIMARASCISMR